MKIDPTTLSSNELYHFMISAIVPRPIAWVGTQSLRGQDNLAPYSFFNGVTSRPPTLMFSAVNNREGKKKDTVVNIEETGEFVVSVVTASQSELMVKTSHVFDYGVSEFVECGVEKQVSERIAPFGVKGAPIVFECLLDRIVVVGEGAGAANLILGKIVLIKVSDEVLVAPDKAVVDPLKLHAIGRMGGDIYVNTESIFSVLRS
jgi:flavin reductase (DIM6/NTAB) family NADH-FMN oxidoreductase RutF